MGAGGRQGGRERERERSVFSVGGRSPGGGPGRQCAVPLWAGRVPGLGGSLAPSTALSAWPRAQPVRLWGRGRGARERGWRWRASRLFSHARTQRSLSPLPSRRRRGRIKKLTARQGHAAGRRFSLPVHGVSGGGLCGRTRAHAWERRGSGGREESGASCVCGGDGMEKEKGECGRTADERAQRPPASTTAVCSPSHYRHNATRDFLRPNPAHPSLRVSHPLRDAARVGADKRHARHHEPGDRHHV